MNDPRSYLLDFLEAVQRETGKPCHLRIAQESGNRQLAIEIGESDGAVLIYIDHGDLAKRPDVLVTECVSLLAEMQKRKATA